MEAPADDANIRLVSETDDDEVRCEIAHLGRDLLLGAVRQTES